jgi:hypothetical protein
MGKRHLFMGLSENGVYHPKMIILIKTSDHQPIDFWVSHFQTSSSHYIYLHGSPKNSHHPPKKSMCGNHKTLEISKKKGASTLGIGETTMTSLDSRLEHRGKELMVAFCIDTSMFL